MNPFKIKKNPQIVHLDKTSRILTLDTQYLILAFSITLASILIKTVNHYNFQFSGNNYLNEHGFFTAILYCVINIIGCYVLVEFNKFTSIFVDIFIVLVTYLIAAFATNAVQLTPFSPIDSFLYQYEFFKLENVVNYFNHHHGIHDFFCVVYNSLIVLMYLLPIIFSIIQRRQEVHNFCRFILLSVSIGFTFYYFFPSCGPASIFDPHLFMKVQHDNHIKFWQIHHGIQPITLNGGLIAFPSFHVIWAWGCCRLFKTVNIYLYYLFLIWFILICMSCFILGWHYSIDIMISLIIIFSLRKNWATSVAQ